LLGIRPLRNNAGFARRSILRRNWGPAFAGTTCLFLFVELDLRLAHEDDILGADRDRFALCGSAIAGSVAQIEAFRFPMGEHPPQIIVPAEIVARSRPSGHSVPIVGAKRKLTRTHPYRLVVGALLLSLVLGLGLVGVIYYAVEEGNLAGYHLVCATTGTGRGARFECHWE
jgi:hypothetical protein